MRNVTVLVTGATGFVGAALCESLVRQGLIVRTAGRYNSTANAETHIRIEDFAKESAWAAALSGVEIVVHLAARTHILDDGEADPLAAFRQVNVLATTALARQAARSGVRRFIFLSSIKVNGEVTPGKPFGERDTPAPEDAYGLSKWEAELGLHGVARDTGIEPVILRPPLIYGPRVKGNFLRLMDAVARGIPLPFASIHNQRSLLYVGNLVDAISACMKSPAAAGKTYLVSDGVDVSTPALIRQMATCLSRPPRLFACPLAALNVAATLLRKHSELQRLTGSLSVDSTLIRHELEWVPRVTLAQGLEATAQWYYRGQN